MVRFGILAPNRKRPRIRLFEAPKHLGTGKLGPKRGEMLLDEGGGFFGRVFYISGRRDSCNPRGVVLVFFSQKTLLQRCKIWFVCPVVVSEAEHTQWKNEEDLFWSPGSEVGHTFLLEIVLKYGEICE